MSEIERQRTKKTFQQSLEVFLRPTVIRMFFLGFSAGLPILLIFSSLSLWLREAGAQRSEVTFFSWAALGYSFKFVWAPLVDRLPLPFLNKLLGRRRSWLLLSQVFIVVAILGMAFTDPLSSRDSLTMMALFAVLLGFSSATQDISLDAYRIECDTKDMQATLSATYIAGYRVGMIVAGAGALYLASYFGSSKASYSYAAWMWTYVIMSAFMGVGIFTTLISPRAKYGEVLEEGHSALEYARFFIFFLLLAASFTGSFFLSSGLAAEMKDFLKALLGGSLAGFIVETFKMSLALIVASLAGIILTKIGAVNRGMVLETYVDPVKEFFQRYGRSVAFLLLSLVGLYRISDIVLGVISNVFYQDLGFTKDEIATVVKTFGVVMTIAGGFLGGVLTVRYGVMKILFLGALLSSLTNILFMFLASSGKSLPLLYVVISADNLSAGLASAAFVAFLSSLTNISFTAIQYAIFSSLMTLLPKVLGGYSGSMVDVMGYQKFFLFTTIIGIPVLFLVVQAGRKLEIKASHGK